MAGMIERVRTAWQVGGQLKQAPPGGYPTSSGLFQLHWPSANLDTRKVGNGQGNSIVESCLSVLVSGFSEAPGAVFQPDETGRQEQANHAHPAALLWRQPNPFMVAGLLWDYLVAACYADGDGYLWKARNTVGLPVQLWPLYPRFVEPRDGSGSLATAEERALHQLGMGPLVAYYEYAPGGQPVRLEVQDVVHLRLGVSKDDLRKGKAPLEPVLREVLGDEEAGNFGTALLQNMGVPGVVLTPAEGITGPTGAQADAILDKWQARFGGRRRGRPLFIEGGALKVQVLSFSPQQMDFKTLRRLPEERVSAATGVPAILAGLGAGLDRATYSNARELREYFTETTVAPRWQLFGDQLTAQLLVDWNPAPMERFGFDTSQVRALQEDQDGLWKRWLEAVRAGACTVAEFKLAVGLDPQPGDEVYLRGASTVEIPVGMDASALEQAAERLMIEQRDQAQLEAGTSEPSTAT